MIPADKEEFAFLIRRQVAASHAVDPDVVDRSQVSVLFDLQDLHALIGDGIQIFSVVRFGQIRRVMNRYHAALGHIAVFQIKIKNVDPDTAAVGIRADIGNIFFACHYYPPGSVSNTDQVLIQIIFIYIPVLAVLR